MLSELFARKDDQCVRSASGEDRVPRRDVTQPFQAGVWNGSVKSEVNQAKVAQLQTE